MTFSTRFTVIVKLALAFLILASANLARADWVTVGQPNLPADATGYGYVPYTYSLSDQVTNTQYAEFMTATYSQTSQIMPPNLGDLFWFAANGSGITNNGNGVFTATLGKENKSATVFIPLHAAFYVNWLENGKGNGSIMTGAYSLTLQSQSIQREASTNHFMPSLDEFYKAVYRVHAPLIQPTDPDLFIPRGEYTESWVNSVMPPPYNVGGSFPHYLAITSANPNPTNLADIEVGYPLTVRFPFRVGVIPEPGSYAMVAVFAIGAIVLMKRRRTLAAN